MRCFVACFLFIVSMAPQMSSAVTTKPPFDVVNINSEKVMPEAEMIPALLKLPEEGYLEEYQHYSDSEKEEVLKKVEVKLLNLGDNEKDVYAIYIEYPQFCGASGNCPSGIIKKTLNGYIKILDGSGIGFNYIDSSNNGMNDVVTSWHMSSNENTITLHEYDGNKYIETGSLWQVTDDSSPNTYFMNNDEHERWLKSREIEIVAGIPQVKEVNSTPLTLEVTGYGPPLPRCERDDSQCISVEKYIKQKDKVGKADVFKMSFNNRPHIYFATSQSRINKNGNRYVLLDVRDGKIHELFDDPINGSIFQVSRSDTVNPNIIVTFKSGLHQDKRYLEYRKGRYIVSKHYYKRRLEFGRMYDVIANREVALVDLYSFSGEVDSNFRPKLKKGHIDNAASTLVKDEFGKFYLILGNGVALTVDEKCLDKSLKVSDLSRLHRRKRIVFSNHYKAKSNKSKAKASVDIGEYEQRFEKIEELPSSKNKQETKDIDYI